MGNVDPSILSHNPAFSAYGEGPCHLQSEYVNHLGEVVGRGKDSAWYQKQNEYWRRGRCKVFGTVRLPEQMTKAQYSRTEMQLTLHMQAIYLSRCSVGISCGTCAD